VPALIFDCDGVLADTERYGHLPAFNAMFAEFGVPLEWSEEDYAQLVRIGGGKERMTSVLTPDFVAAHHLPDDPDDLAALVGRWHRRKTEIYTGLVESGALPPRPGIARIAAAARAGGWQLAVASTSAEPAVRSVLEHAVGPELAPHFSVFAGDIVPRKKPAPDIYQLALDRLAIPASEGVAIEDSANGLRAALGAGLACVVTTSSYTRDEDFTGAALVVTTLGDPAGPGGDATYAEVVDDPLQIAPGPQVELADLAAVLSRHVPSSQPRPEGPS